MVHEAHRAARAQRGHGTTAYITIIALISVATIAIYRYSAETIRSQVSSMAKEISGQRTDAAIDKLKVSGTKGTENRLSAYQPADERHSTRRDHEMATSTKR